MAAAKKKSRPRLPNKVKICGHEYKIRYPKVLPDGSEDSGMIEPSKLLISVNKNMGGLGDTIIHEILHGILTESGVWEGVKAAKDEEQAEEILIGVVVPHLREALKSIGWREPKALSQPKDK